MSTTQNVSLRQIYSFLDVNLQQPVTQVDKANGKKQNNLQQFYSNI